MIMDSHYNISAVLGYFPIPLNQLSMMIARQALYAVSRHNFLIIRKICEFILLFLGIMAKHGQILLILQRLILLIVDSNQWHWIQ